MVERGLRVTGSGWTGGLEGRPIRQVPRSNSALVHRRLKEELLEALSRVLFGDHWEGLQVVADFEAQFGAEMGYSYVSAVQSGSAGLRLSLMACGVKPGDEVITVANSDISTSAAISQCGATPVLCDVTARDYTMNADLVERLITERTAGLLPVDLYGHPADVRRLREIAELHDLFIVEDAAIAPGARDYGEPVGFFADMTVFSCATDKPFGGIGNGGLVVTEQEELWQRLELLKGYGLQAEVSAHPPVRYDHVAEGYNLTMAPSNAAVLSVKLPYLKEWSEKRRLIGRWYEEGLASLAGIVLPSFRLESEPVFRTYSVRIEGRDRAFRILHENGVQAALHYVPPIHLRPAYQARRLPGSNELPETEKASEEMLCLPVDPTFSKEEVNYVCNLMSSVVGGSSMGI